VGGFKRCLCSPEPAISAKYPALSDALHPPIRHERPGYLQHSHRHTKPLPTSPVRMAMGLSESPSARAGRVRPPPRGFALLDARRYVLQPPPPPPRPGHAREHVMVCGSCRACQNFVNVHLLRARCTTANLRARVRNANSTLGIIRAIVSGLSFEISRVRREVQKLHEKLKVINLSKRKAPA
jgi:hypothetical protein